MPSGTWPQCLAVSGDCLGHGCMEPSPAAARPPAVPAWFGMEPRPERSFQLSICTPATPGWVVVVWLFCSATRSRILTVTTLTFVRCSLQGAVLCVWLIHWHHPVVKLFIIKPLTSSYLLFIVDVIPPAETLQAIKDISSSFTTAKIIFCLTFFYYYFIFLLVQWLQSQISLHVTERGLTGGSA